jgi:hypothetical protein
MKINWRAIIILWGLLLWGSGVFGSPKQMQPDKQRVLQIQVALINNGYLNGVPSGKWDQKTKDALAIIAREHGWQVKHVPDAQVLILLGLGPNTAGIDKPVYPASYRNRLKDEKPVDAAVASYCVDLAGCYAEFNTQYYDGKLPKDTVIELTSKQIFVAQTSRVTTYGNVISTHFLIRINTDYATEGVFEVAVLAHEMCHVKVWDEETTHGNVWENCMFDLSKKNFYENVFILTYSRERPIFGEPVIDPNDRRHL